MISRLKPRETEYRIAEPHGRGEGALVIRVRPGGAKHWFYRYTHDGKDKVRSIGTYSESARRGSGFTLMQARAEVKRLRPLQEEHGDLGAFFQVQKREKRLELKQKAAEAR